MRCVTPRFLDIEWTPENRLESIHDVMAFSARDWSVYQSSSPGTPDAEQWAIWCLSCCKTKIEAQAAWRDFCIDENKGCLMMKTLSNGMPSTLGSYKKISIFFGKKAQKFIQKKIDESPNGEDEEVIADESQMIYLLSTMQDAILTRTD